MKKNFSQSVVLALAMALSGCAGTPVTLGSQPYAPPPAGGQARDLSAKACGFQLLLFIPININDRQLRAYESLKKQAAGDYLTDLQWHDEWFYGFVGTGYCTTLTAKAIKAAPAAATASN